MKALSRLAMKNYFLEERVETLGRRIEEEAGSKIPQNYGLCSSCKNFYFRRTELMDEECVCVHWVSENIRMKLQPKTYDTISDCSGFYPRGQMSVAEMASIAWVIDVNKRQIGFQGVEETEVKITSPEDREGND
jgi:hypothetical protein